MHPGDTRAFYRSRRTLIALALAAPLALAAGLWWAIDRYALSMREPTASAPAEEWFRYIVDPQGLARTDRAARERFFHRHLDRAREEAYARTFAAEYRSATAEEQQRIVTMLWDTFLPRILDDARTYFAASDAEVSKAHLDDCLVRYNRLIHALRATRFGKADRAGGEIELFLKLAQRLSDADQAMVGRFWERLQGRIAEALADDVLRGEFERRIAEPADGSRG
ncbi:MAG: hypothetical protein IPM64_06590 [Phycisphaerales bacterium]|nr:hypothetical protein [Phycisphaerales bacterium]